MVFVEGVIHENQDWEEGWHHVAELGRILRSLDRYHPRLRRRFIRLVSRSAPPTAIPRRTTRLGRHSTLLVLLRCVFHGRFEFVCGFGLARGALWRRIWNDAIRSLHSDPRSRREHLRNDVVDSCQGDLSPHMTI